MLELGRTARQLSTWMFGGFGLLSFIALDISPHDYAKTHDDQHWQDDW